MADLTETSQWVPVIQIETDDVLQGGPGGKANEQAQDLADRTAYLKAEIEANDTDIATNTADIATNTAGIAQEITDRGTADTNLQNQIDAINPYTEEIYSSSGAAVGQHNLSSGKTFNTYDLLIFTIENASKEVAYTMTANSFASGITQIMAVPINSLPRVEVNWADNDTFEVTVNSTNAGIVKIEGLKN